VDGALFLLFGERERFLRDGVDFLDGADGADGVDGPFDGERFWRLFLVFLDFLFFGERFWRLFLLFLFFLPFGDMFWREGPDLEQLSPLRLTHLPAALYPQTLGERFSRELLLLDLLRDLTLLKIFLSVERFSKDSRDDLSERSPTGPAAWVGICPRILTLPSSLRLTRKAFLAL